jgi:hypothetical protein
MKSNSKTEEMNNRLLHIKKCVDWKKIQRLLHIQKNHFRHIELMISLIYLKHTFKLRSNYLLIEKWDDDYTWQYFSGIEYLGKPCPILSSDLSVFESVIGRDGYHILIQEFANIEDRELHSGKKHIFNLREKKSMNEYLYYLNMLNG